MDPVTPTLATAALISSIAGAAAGTVGAVTSANAQANASNYQAAVARNNQIIASQNAARSAQAGRVQAQNEDFKTRARVGAIESGEAAGGVDIDSGSPLDVRRSTSQLGRLDALTLMDNADQSVRASQIAAAGFGSQAQVDKTQASQAPITGGFNAATSLLGGASSFADKWLKYQDQGIKVF